MTPWDLKCLGELNVWVLLLLFTNNGNCSSEMKHKLRNEERKENLWKNQDSSQSLEPSRKISLKEKALWS